MDDYSVVGALARITIAVSGMLVLRIVMRRQTDPFIAKAILFGVLAKVFGTLARYFLITDLYGESGDFLRYVRNGDQIASVIRSGSLPDQARETGTPFMDFIAGVLFTVAPSTLLVGFAAFSTLAFVGQYLFLRAFQLALPDGDHRRYALLILFVPTMLFWPSSIGKEAWLVFTLGVACYGAARVLRKARFGYLVTLLGGAGVFAVRPHMGALFALTFAGAFVLRFRDPEVNSRAVGWIVGLLVISLGAGYAAVNFGDLLPQDEAVDGTQTDQIFAETSRRTTQGGSSYETRPVEDPIDFLYAAVTVPFRPFPHEAHNRQAQVSGLEGVILLGLVVASIPRLRRLPLYLLRRPYVAMSTVYCAGFIIAFSNVGNFGIITRQRAQLLPLLFVLLALPVVQSRREGRPTAAVLTPLTAEQQDAFHADAGEALSEDDQPDLRAEQVLGPTDQQPRRL
jgi:hypothetical protein